MPLLSGGGLVWLLSPVWLGGGVLTKADQSYGQFELEENESTFIPIGVKHRLENPFPEPVEIIEVQSGSYLGDDDIERFEDMYGRGTKNG